jgi:hypothetical protein
MPISQVDMSVKISASQRSADQGCEQRGGPRATRRSIEALGLAAKLLGLLPERRPSSPSKAVTIGASEPSQRLDDLIAKAEAALGPAVKKTQANASDADQHARTLGLPSAHPATPQPSSIPISVAAADQLASATTRGRPGPVGYLRSSVTTFMGVG